MLTQIPNGLDEIIATYGSLDEGQFETKHIVLFNLPYALKFEGQTVTHARCHSVVVDNFIQAFQNVEAAGLKDQFIEFNGIYAKRLAIDMGASTHPLGQMVPWPQGIIDAFASAGFFWGGNFKSRKDCMHFQLATGY